MQTYLLIQKSDLNRNKKIGMPAKWSKSDARLGRQKSESKSPAINSGLRRSAFHLAVDELNVGFFSIDCNVCQTIDSNVSDLLSKPCLLI